MDRDISLLRLASQQVTGTSCRSVKEIVHHMGAIQAQDFSMAKWAIGSRLTGSTEADVNAAINNGEIIRTHLLRPTWHFISAEDVRWMIELTAPGIKGSMKSRQRQLGLDEGIQSRSREIIFHALQGGRHLTREQIMAEIKRAGIPTDQNRSSHLLMLAELEGLICSGKIIQGKPTYTLMDEWVPLFARLTRDEALEMLALRYFTGHGPATVRDFSWWSGLGMGDARRAMELAGHKLLKETFGGREYHLSPFLPPSRPHPDHALLMAAYDEIVIGYSDRSAILSSELNRKAISINGLFRPVIIVAGEVTGTWKWFHDKGRTLLETDFFSSPDQKILKLLDDATVILGRFLGKKTEIRGPR